MSQQARTNPLPTAVLLSGAGRTLQNLLDRQHSGQLPTDVRLVISSRASAGGLAIAQRFGVTHHVITRAGSSSAEAFSEAIFSRCRSAGIELVAMAGFMQHVSIPPDFENRVMNIHPALIPAFCGQGYYGTRVHQAVLDYGAKVSGCTVHFTDNQYDHGPIILQRTVPVRDDDTVESLAARVFAQECQAYPEAIALLAAGRLRVEGRRVRVLPA